MFSKLLIELFNSALLVIPSGKTNTKSLLIGWPISSNSLNLLIIGSSIKNLSMLKLGETSLMGG